MSVFTQEKKEKESDMNFVVNATESKYHTRGGERKFGYKRAFFYCYFYCYCILESSRMCRNDLRTVPIITSNDVKRRARAFWAVNNEDVWINGCF